MFNAQSSMTVLGLAGDCGEWRGRFNRLERLKAQSSKLKDGTGDDIGGYALGLVALTHDGVTG